MSEFIREDKVYSVPIVNGELLISPSHDFLHHWHRNGAWMLKYYNTEAEPPRMCNIPVSEVQARYLIDNCGLEVCQREFIGTQEHEHYLAWQATQLDDLDFEVDESASDDTIEE